MIYIGCAGWSIPSAARTSFPAAGSHLERYATRLNAVEINSSFYRSHLPRTYARWKDSTPPGFRFSVKLPRHITHEARMVSVRDAVTAFAEQVSALGEKLGCVLVQLPPSLAFDAATAETFFENMRTRLTASIVLEPRHASWSGPVPTALLAEFDISRVLADPEVLPDREPLKLEYHRLHGSPQMYYSAYDASSLSARAADLRNFSHSGKDAWCIFDNTAAGAAMPNALRLLSLLEGNTLATRRSLPSHSPGEVTGGDR